MPRADAYLAEAKASWERKDYEGAIGSAIEALMIKQGLLGAGHPDVADIEKRIAAARAALVANSNRAPAPSAAVAPASLEAIEMDSLLKGTEKETAILAAVRKFGEALANPSVAAFKPVVTEGCMLGQGQRFWDHCTDAYFENMNGSGQSLRIETIKRVALPLPDQAAVQLVIVAEDPDGTQRKEGWLNFGTKEGGWKMLGSSMEPALFP